MILLASQSPRRRELLAQIGCSFEVLVSDAEEVMTDALAPEVRENARRKALAVAKLRPDVPVLGADTVVARAGHIYGKPKDPADARRMLASLAGGAHEVLTGIAFAHHGRVFDDVVRTRVFFAPMTQEEIVRYVATGERRAGQGGGVHRAHRGLVLECRRAAAPCRLHARQKGGCEPWHLTGKSKAHPRRFTRVGFAFSVSLVFEHDDFVGAERFF